MSLSSLQSERDQLLAELADLERRRADLLCAPPEYRRNRMLEACDRWLPVLRAELAAMPKEDA